MKKILLCIAIFHVGLVQANNFSDRVQVKVRAGYSIGATAPIGIPATIRSIESYRLTPNLMLGADVVLPFSEKWGVTTGLHFENKGLDGEITTKGYRMKVRMDESELEGYFTGHVRQKVRQWMLTLPIEATLQLSNKLQLRGGPCVSVLTNRDFSGYAFSGYLRVDDPTGARVDMGDTEGQWATYDFTDELRRLQFGLSAGVDWQLHRRFGASFDLSWGLTGIHKSSFKTIEQTLYPIYGTLGIFYRLK